MISGIGNQGQMQNMFRMQETKLTKDQKSKLQEIIGKYDPENMTSDSTKTMMEEIKSAGIGPSREFGEIMNAAGFKPPEKPEGPPPDGVQSAGAKREMPAFLTDFLAKQESGEVTDEDITTLLQNLLEQGKEAKGSIIDQKV